MLSNGTLTVTAYALTVTADAQSKSLWRHRPGADLSDYQGSLQNGDSLSGSLIRVTGEDVGSYAIQLGSLAASTNYTLTYVPANLTISAKPITVTADAKSKTYGDSDPGLTYSITSGSLVGNDSVSGSLTRAAGENAGDYAIQQGTLTAGGNYNLTYIGANLTITLRPVLAQADNQTRAYGQTNPVFTITYTGFVGSDSVTNLAELPTASTIADTNSSPGTYDITLTGGSDTNYSLVLSNGTLTVTSYTLTVTADDQSRAYGEANPTLTGSLVGLENGDNITANYSTAATVTNFVGTYPITVTLSDPDGKLANYIVTTNNATLTITNRAITVTAVVDNKIYDGTDTSVGVPTISPGSLVNGDTGTWTQHFNTKDTTADTLIPSGSVSDGNGGNNYNISFVSIPTQSIHRRGVTATASDATRVYGAANPTVNLSYNGFVAGEDDSVLSGTPGLSTAADLNSNVGEYDINVNTNGITALNYYLVPAKGKLTITPASATVGVVPTNGPSRRPTASPSASNAFAERPLHGDSERQRAICRQRHEQPRQPRRPGQRPGRPQRSRLRPGPRQQHHHRRLLRRQRQLHRRLR